VTQDHAKLHVFRAPVPNNHFQIFTTTRLSKRYENFVIILFSKHTIQSKWRNYFFYCFFPQQFIFFSLPVITHEKLHKSKHLSFLCNFKKICASYFTPFSGIFYLRLFPSVLKQPPETQNVTPMLSLITQLLARMACFP
jgi:hypothetical protein